MCWTYCFGFFGRFSVIYYFYHTPQWKLITHCSSQTIQLDLEKLRNWYFVSKNGSEILWEKNQMIEKIFWKVELSEGRDFSKNWKQWKVGTIFEKGYFLNLLLEAYTVDTIQDFLCKLGMKTHVHLVEISIFSLNHVFVRPTKKIRTPIKPVQQT